MMRDQDDAVSTILSAACFALLWAASYSALLTLMGVEL